MIFLNCINLPDSGYKLYDGTIVILSRFPGTRWIVHNGHYMYNGSSYTGWYFSSIPAQTTLPVTVEDLRLCIIVDTGNCPPYPPCPIPPGPCPAPAPVPDMARMEYQLDRAFITVETLEERDRLVRYNLPNGKMVRVNSVDGSAQYYEWDDVNKQWNATKLADTDLSKYYTSAQCDEKFATIEYVNSRFEDLINNVLPTLINSATGKSDTSDVQG